MSSTLTPRPTQPLLSPDSPARLYSLCSHSGYHFLTYYEITYLCMFIVYRSPQIKYKFYEGRVFLCFCSRVNWNDGWNLVHAQ